MNDARGRLTALAKPPIQWLTRIRLLLLGHEELLGLVLWAAATGILGALASVAFREGVRLFQWMLTGQAGSLVEVAGNLTPLHRALTPVVGGIAAGLVLQFGARVFSRRRSIDYMEAVVVGDGAIAARPTLLRSLSSLLTIGSGGSIGREGPMVQLSALLGSKLGSWSRAAIPRRRLLVACGAAAGIACAYNAPIAGALFVAEIVLGSIAMESFGPLLVASLAASVTTHRFLGYGPVFAVPRENFGANWELVVYGLLGIVLGHLSPAFLAALDWTKARAKRLPLPRWATLGLGGAVVGVASIALPEVWGNGYSVVGSILHGEYTGPLLLAILAAKIFCTVATVGSGAVGGVFTPTLFIGAAVGALMNAVLHAAWPATASSQGAYALVGMGGFLAATTHAPLTSILMIFEMTLDYDVVLPLMLACVTAHYTAKVYRGGHSVYHDALQGSAQGAAERSGGGGAGTVTALLKEPAAVVQEDTTVRAMLDGLPRRAVQSVYVVDARRQLLLVLDPRRVLTRVQKGELDPDVPVGLVRGFVPGFVTPEMSLPAALEVFLRDRSTVLPVIAGSWRPVLLGELSRHDLVLAMQDLMSAKEAAPAREATAEDLTPEPHTPDPRTPGPRR